MAVFGFALAGVSEGSVDTGLVCELGNMWKRECWVYTLYMSSIARHSSDPQMLEVVAVFAWDVLLFVARSHLLFDALDVAF